ncbi:MAG: response regulator [Elusimicrobia bacterium]|nr:response regulator [Elusimicrobiota bacterium]
MPEDSKPDTIELGTRYGVPLGAKAIRPKTSVDTPIADEERVKFEAIVGPADALKPPPPPAGLTALIADDEPYVRAYVKTVLGLVDCAATECREGPEAIKAVATMGLSLLVLDLSLPGGIDGFGVLRCVRSYMRRTDLPICVITGSKDPRDELAALKLGADDFIVKPSDVGRLKARFSLLLRKTSK